MRAKVWAAAITAGVIGYLVLVAARAGDFIAAGGPVAIALGLSIAVLPLIGAWVVWREIRFGVAVQRLADRLAAQGRLPVDDLPRTPSGRVQRAAADARFEQVRARVEAEPEDPAAWFALAVAYDDARDRKRARAAMRTALAKAAG